MPYVSPLYREMGLNPRAAGELNYWITALINNYVLDEGLSYQTINDIIGALEGAKAEFYRRVVAPYEDKKIIENGDVYTVDIAEVTRP